MPTVGDYVKGDKKAVFQYYRENVLYYKVDDLLFPIPLSDLGQATVNHTEKAILLMRYIRKHLAEMQQEV